MPIGEGSATVKLHFVGSYEKRSTWGLGEGSPHRAEPLTRAGPAVFQLRGEDFSLACFSPGPRAFAQAAQISAAWEWGLDLSCPHIVGFPELCHIMT